jgi:hypothetical protein
MISEVVSDLLDFLDKKEEFKTFLMNKQKLREADSKKKDSKEESVDK